MDENCSDSADLGSPQRLQYGVLQQRSPDSLSLKGHIHRKPPYHHDGNGIGHIAPHPSRCILMFDSPHGESIVTHNTAGLADNVRAGCSALLVGMSSALEPIIESWFSALELRHIVCRVKVLRRGDFFLYLSHGAFVLIRRSSPGFLAGGLSSMS